VRLDAAQARARFGRARVAYLATADGNGRPHLVPIVFAMGDGDVLYSAVDRKPKTSSKLKRLANIASNPRVAVLADHYEEDWTRLWWVRADGTARIATGAEAEVALGLLASRYPQYAADRPPGPVLAVDVRTWTGWSAT
jgi:PPOX class probable F420-dependent enzyme